MVDATGGKSSCAADAKDVEVANAKGAGGAEILADGEEVMDVGRTGGEGDGDGDGGWLGMMMVVEAMG